MTRTHALLATVVAVATGVSATAQAETRLSTSVYTATPAGFLVTSTLVAGEREAVLIDGQFSLADAHRLVAMILESKRTLTTVFVTHSHPDHYFGLNVIKQAFPKVKVLATPATIAAIQKTWKGKVKQWGATHGHLVPRTPIIPTPLQGTTLSLEGQTLEIKSPAGGDAADSTYVWIPSIRTVVAGDVVFRGVHPWTAESAADARKAWIRTLDEIAALKPDVVIAGHKDPTFKDDTSGVKQTRDYLEAFEVAIASSTSAAEVQDKLEKRFPDLQLDIILQVGAAAQFASAPTTPEPPAAAPVGKAATAVPARR